MSELIQQQIAFIRRAGTPKLKACSDDTLARYLGRRDLVAVWVPDEALGLGWFTGNGSLYVANLMAVSPAALVKLLERFYARFPWVTKFEGDRVPGPLRRQRPDLDGTRHRYDDRLFDRLARFATHRAERARRGTALRQADLSQALGLHPLPAAGRHAGPAGVESPAGGLGVLGLLSPITA